LSLQVLLSRTLVSGMRIENINDILPSIEGRSDFVVADKGLYIVIDYLYTQPDSFDDPIRRECRGIKFDKETGDIIARPFAKFFNIGEREETVLENIDFNREYIITEKLDGSMVHACMLEGEIVLMTRMGRTEHAKEAEKLLTGDLIDTCKWLLEEEWTPIFEWTSPNNRIVLRYDTAQLTLLAIRNTINGHYLSMLDLFDEGENMGVSIVTHVSSRWKTPDEFLSYTKALTDKEGFVIYFPHDHTRVKVKSDDYVIKHKAKSSFAYEKNILSIILEDKGDDLIPLLSDEDADDFKRYRTSVGWGITTTALNVLNIVRMGKHLSQKDFAVDHLSGVDAKIRSICFRVRGGTDSRSAVVETIKKGIGSTNKIEEVRHLFNANWICGEDKK